MHLLHCSLYFYSSSSSSFLPLFFSFLPLLFSFLLSPSPSFSSFFSTSHSPPFSFFLPKLLPSLFFFFSFPLPSFSSSFHSVFLLCPFLLLPSLAFPFFWSSSIYSHLVFLSFFLFFFEGTACTECFSRCNRGHH